MEEISGGAPSLAASLNACDCIESISKTLREEHNALMVCTLFSPQKAVIGTEKIDSKKRSRPPMLIASFCPFCGVKYPSAKSTSEDGAPPQSGLSQ